MNEKPVFKKGILLDPSITISVLSNILVRVEGTPSEDVTRLKAVNIDVAGTA